MCRCDSPGWYVFVFVTLLDETLENMCGSKETIKLGGRKRMFGTNVKEFIQMITYNYSGFSSRINYNVLLKFLAEICPHLLRFMSAL